MDEYTRTFPADMSDEEIIEEVLEELREIRRKATILARLQATHAEINAWLNRPVPPLTPDEFLDDMHIQNPWVQ